MPSEALPDAGSSVRPADLRQAGAWLVRHGLADARPTPLLAVRLAARRRARLADHIMLAALMLAAALAQAYDRLATSAYGGFGPHSQTPLLVLTVLVVALLLVRSLLDQWVRRVDRRAGAALSRRAAHPLQPGWRAMLGRPYAAFTVATFAGAMALAASALTVPDSTVRYAAFILLVGLLGVAVGVVLQLRDLLTRPVVAEDEVSLTADVIMRIEDARELTAPTVPWALPVVLLFGTAFGWWNAAALVLALLGFVASHVIHARTPSIVTMARRAMSAR
ncbi:hypothetical protein [Streptosporangium sp. 'caverna']|uniref:hypothetical protein n=1 Tax=Streptosporangium sp. 'caverna' TaxID=2202249 RepID=UPI000D7E0D5C|nr:hypothetical protein [Streptosporangium sp. 'caverna']AWS44570.1 hypothetical protein DKM19_27720 [Streptosporangium sp. 'caverna']